MRTYSINNSDNNMNNEQPPDFKDLKKKTNKYPIYNVYITPERIKKVPDLLNGGLRKRKFGLILGMGAIPDFNKMDDPPMVETMRVPQILIDADTIEDLKKAAIYEITKMCTIMQKFIDGEVLNEEDITELQINMEEDEEEDEEEGAM